MMRPVAISAAILAVLGLSACDQSREMLGLDKQAPDEFAVYSRAPLSLPPDYGLKPPKPGEKRPQIQDTRIDARKALLGNRQVRTSVPAGSSPGLQALMRRTGADAADSSIRDEINQETSVLAEEDQTFTDRIMFMGVPTEYGSVVDPDKETKRIQENQALGKPINEGEVPVMERKRKGLLEGLVK